MVCCLKSVLHINSCIATYEFHVVYTCGLSHQIGFTRRSNLQFVLQLFNLPIEQSPVLNLLHTPLKKTQWLIILQSLCIVSESVSNIVQTPLTAAARKGDIQEVLRLLQNGEDPNPPTVCHFHHL